MGEIKVNSKGPQEQNNNDNADDVSSNAAILKREATAKIPLAQDLNNQNKSPFITPIPKNEAEDLIKNSSVKEGKTKIDDFMNLMLVSDDLFQEDKQELRSELKREKPKKAAAGGEHSGSSGQGDTPKNNSRLILEQTEKASGGSNAGIGILEQKKIDDADINGIKENDFSLTLKSKRIELARENKESHKFLNNELSRGMKHYHVILDKYPESKAAFEKADVFPKLNRELKQVIAPVIESKTAGVRAFGLGLELPGILKAAHTFHLDNSIDQDIMAPLIKRAVSLNLSHSPLVRQFGRDLAENLKGLISDNLQLKEKSLNALDSLLKDNNNFLSKLKTEDPIISGISKSGPQASEKLYKQYMEKVEVEKLLQENPEISGQMQLITDNFVRNLHILGEANTKDADIINETLFAKAKTAN